MIQFSFSPEVSIQPESTTVYLEFCSLNITTINQSSFFPLVQTTWYFQRQAWVWKVFKIPHLELAEQKSHPCYQWGHLNLLAVIFISTKVQFCAANHTHKMTWNQPNPGEEPRTAKRLSHAWGRKCKWSKKGKKKGVDLLLRTKRELTRTRLKTVHIMEIQEMHH